MRLGKSTKERVYKCPKGTQIPEANNRACWGMPSMTPKALPGCGLGPFSGPQKSLRRHAKVTGKAGTGPTTSYQNHQRVRWGQWVESPSPALHASSTTAAQRQLPTPTQYKPRNSWGNAMTAAHNNADNLSPLEINKHDQLQSMDVQL